MGLSCLRRSRAEPVARKRYYCVKVRGADGVWERTHNNTESGMAPWQSEEHLKMREEAYAWAARVKLENEAVKPKVRAASA